LFFERTGKTFGIFGFLVGTGSTGWLYYLKLILVLENGLLFVCKFFLKISLRLFSLLCFFIFGLGPSSS
jgi:hypothetical protein